MNFFRKSILFLTLWCAILMQSFIYSENSDYGTIINYSYPNGNLVANGSFEKNSTPWNLENWTFNNNTVKFIPYNFKTHPIDHAQRLDLPDQYHKIVIDLGATVTNEPTWATENSKLFIYIGAPQLLDAYRINVLGGSFNTTTSSWWITAEGPGDFGIVGGYYTDKVKIFNSPFIPQPSNNILFEDDVIYDNNNVLISNYKDVYEGKGMLAVKYESQFSHDLFTSFELTDNTKYTFSAKYRILEHEGDFFHPHINVYEGSDYTPIQTFEGADYLVNSTGDFQWRSMSFEFETGNEGQRASLFLLSRKHPLVENAKAYVYFDNVSIIPTGFSSIVSKKYLDANNRIVRTLNKRGVNSLTSLVNYDKYGRVSTDYLPILENNEKLDVLPDYASQLLEFWDGDPNTGPFQGGPDAGGVPFDYSVYELSALGRKLTHSQSGLDWSFQLGKNINTLYGSATGLTSTPIFTEYDHPDPIDDTFANSVNTNNYFLTETIDESGRKNRAYKDKFGYIVRTGVQKEDDSWVNTDYQYDVKGNLLGTYSPNVGYYQLQSQNVYNSLNQLIEEDNSYVFDNGTTITSNSTTGKTRIIYDQMGRVRFTQSEKQGLIDDDQDGDEDADDGEPNVWFSYIKYDNNGRVKEEGEMFYTEVSTLLPINYTQCITDGYINFNQECANEQNFPPDNYSTKKVSIINHYDAPFPTTQHSPELKNGCYISEEENKEIIYLVYFDGSADESLNDNDNYGEVKRFNSLDNAYNFVFNNIENISALVDNITVYQLYDDNNLSAALTPGFQFNGIPGFTIKIKPMDFLSSPYYIAIGYEQEKWGPLKGKLVNTLTYNYNVSSESNEFLAKTFNYDKYGNITELYEYNGFAPSGKKCQLTKNKYDMSNRIIKKTVCLGIDCLSAESVEKYHYDDLGRLEKVTSEIPTDHIVKNTYNELGQLDFQIFGNTENKIKVDYNYHLHGMVNDLEVVDWNSASQNWNTSSYIFREELEFEESDVEYGGNITKANYTFSSDVNKSNLDLTQNYTYDMLNRLIESNSNKYEYFDDGRIYKIDRYDPTENNLLRRGIFGYNGSGQLKFVGTVAGIDQLVSGRSLNSPTNFQYDVNGLLIVDESKPNNLGAPFVEYNSNDLPYKFTYTVDLDPEIPGAENYESFMLYDEGGKRVSKITHKNGIFSEAKHYFSSGLEIREDHNHISNDVYDLAGVGRTIYNSNGVGQIEREYYLKNHLGTTMEIYNETDGKMNFAVQYQPLGKEYGREATSNVVVEDVTPKFTGKELDEGIELSYFGARYYDADIGLWISPDPARQFHGLYSYTGNGYNPINAIDPDGNQILDDNLAWRANINIRNSRKRQAFQFRRRHNRIMATADVVTLAAGGVGVKGATMGLYKAYKGRSALNFLWKGYLAEEAGLGTANHASSMAGGPKIPTYTTLSIDLLGDSFDLSKIQTQLMQDIVALPFAIYDAVTTKNLISAAGSANSLVKLGHSISQFENKGLESLKLETK